jgi:hypothetical protein
MYHKDTEERDVDPNQITEDDKFDGIIRELGSLAEHTVLYESALAAMFHRHKVSIKRAVERGELPPGAKMFGEQAWTVKAIREHITERLAKAAKEAEKLRQRINKLST